MLDPYSMSTNFIIVLTLDKPVFQGLHQFGAQSLSFDFFKNSVEVNGIIYTTICRQYIFDKLFVSHCKIGKKMPIEIQTCHNFTAKGWRKQ